MTSEQETDFRRWATVFGAPDSTFPHGKTAVLLLAELDRLRALVLAQAERIAQQSELLAKAAERRTPGASS